jgi:hypothetical protein
MSFHDVFMSDDPTQVVPDAEYYDAALYQKMEPHFGFWHTWRDTVYHLAESGLRAYTSSCDSPGYQRLHCDYMLDTTDNSVLISLCGEPKLMIHNDSLRIHSRMCTFSGMRGCYNYGVGWRTAYPSDSSFLDEWYEKFTKQKARAQGLHGEWRFAGYSSGGIWYNCAQRSVIPHSLHVADSGLTFIPDTGASVHQPFDFCSSQIPDFIHPLVEGCDTAGICRINDYRDTLWLITSIEQYPTDWSTYHSIGYVRPR